MRSRLAFVVVVLLMVSVGFAETGTLKTGKATVNYAGITRAQASSLGEVADAARTATIARFGPEVPDAISVNVDCKPANTVRLFTDGRDTYTLSIRSESDLAPPAQSGINNLYGMCHELGHVVMYRPFINATLLLTGDACEGWAHYFGSQIVDDVYAQLGEKAWWQPYDYRADGTMRLEKQLAAGKTDGTTAAAGLWRDMVKLVGEKNVAKVFAAWEKADVNAAEPAKALGDALATVSSDPKLSAWWAKASPVLVKPSRMSKLAAATKPAANKAAPAAGKSTELALDDGKSAGKKSIAGSGHAVGFETSAEGCKLTAVKIFGSRYGTQAPPAEDFHVYLCDSDGKQIKDFPFPYKNFLRGGDRWVTLKLPEAAEVPQKFILCVSFNPTQTKGVYVHYDAKPDGDSRAGLPGELNDAFDKGDWMIRATLTEPTPAK